MKEIIQTRSQPELRGTDQKVLAGYGAVFYRAGEAGTEFELGSGTVERILPGAFNLSSSDDVVALYSHDFNTPLGRTSAGTLRLSVDARGLRYEIDLPDTQAGRDVAESVSRGDITGSSFGFTVPTGGARMRTDDGVRIRELTRIDLIEVSPVVFPAYSGTEANMRSANAGDVLAAISFQERKARARRLIAAEL